MSNPTQSSLKPIPYDLRLYTPAEAAAILNVSLRKLQDWIRSEQLPHTRLGDGGRLVRIRAADLQAFIDSNYNNGR